MTENNQLKLQQFIKFICVGILNTLITYITYLLFRYLSTTPEISNLIGYIVGLINSFFWNKLWVFKEKKGSILKEATLFICIFGICYIAQLGCFKLLLYKLQLNEYIVQFMSMCIYTLLNYTLNKKITFKHGVKR